MQPQHNETIGGRTLVQGWVSQPENRGTFDIAVSCAVTIFLCSWSAICPNIPVAGNSKRDLFWDKWHMFCLSMLGPEFVFLLALGQFQSARTSLRNLRNLGCTDWTLKHAFYADMGGFVFQARGWKAFPVNANQLQYLLKRRYVAVPNVPVELLDDRDKSDGLARFGKTNLVDGASLIAIRFIATVQMIWFVLNVIARPTQKLAVSALEITTVAFVFCTLGTAFCWKKKPMDISTTILLDSDYTMQEILTQAGSAASKPYNQTPLDFVGREDWIVTLLWKFNVSILRRMHAVRQRPKILPAQRISSFNFPQLSRTGMAVALFLALAYCAIFLAAWNLEFPSLVERLLWQICTSITIGLTLIGGIVEILSIRRGNEANVRKASQIDEQTKTSSILPIFDRSRQRNKAGPKEPSETCSNETIRLEIPLRSLLLTQPICAIYTVCRVLILMEDIIGLRSLPASSFQNVDWTAYWPHI